MSDQAIGDALRAERSWFVSPEGREFFNGEAFNAYEARCEAESNRRKVIREIAQKAFELDIPFETIEELTSLPVPKLLAIQAEVQRQRNGAIPG